LVSQGFLDTKQVLIGFKFRKSLFCFKTPSFCEKTNIIYFQLLSISAQTAKTLFLFYPWHCKLYGQES
jgi:hypothetical protein